MSKRYAIISIGTNSTRLLLADLEPDVPQAAVVRSIGTRIGEGLGEAGNLGDEPMRRTLDAAAQLLRTVRGHYVRLFAVATSALRRAHNGDEFARRAQETLGVALRVLSGDEEAAGSYRGALVALAPLRGERVGTIDVGGGSTEYAIGTTNEPERTLSCEIGAVRLTEAVPALAGREGPVSAGALEQARAIAREALAPLRDCEPVERVAFVGGSATTTAAIARGRQGSPNSYRLERADLQRVLAQLVGMTLEERKSVVGMKRQRADILPGGLIVLEAALDAVGLDAGVATTADLLLGLLLQRRDSEAPAAGQGRPVTARSEARRGA